jgi:hypothetical protein
MWSRAEAQMIALNEMKLAQIREMATAGKSNQPLPK